MGLNAESGAGRRTLPAVDTVLRAPDCEPLIERFGRTAVVDAVRSSIAAARAGGEALSTEVAVRRAMGLLQAADAPRLKAVFNLTGTVLHTNLGRAILAEEAIEAAVAAMRQAVALEFDLDGARRGERDDVVRGLLCELTGGEDATVVNNNAAAMLIVLNTLAKGKRAIVSRGELIEIGGAFRLPEIMARAGARLVEVGTTNRTHLRDYEAALDAGAGLVLKVHPSNFRIEGFTAQVTAGDVARAAHGRGVPLVDDLGSGALVELSRYGITREPTVAEAVAAGADLVTFSGDKLLGGPQAGFIAGRKDLIARINRNPMKRALRVDKLRLAAIEATLKLYRDPDRLAERLPTLRLLSRKAEEIEARARRMAPVVEARLHDRFGVEVVGCMSQVGSGALPTDGVPSAGLAIRSSQAKASGRALAALAAAFRALPMPVIGRVTEQALVLDCRCLEDEPGFVRNLETLRLVP